jgi:hypothetical protein
MSRRDWLLLLIGASERSSGLDPVRVQKGMFLLAREAGLPPAERYAFRPYNYGPMSVGVYADLDALVHCGLVVRVPVEGLRWTCSALSSAGAARAAALTTTARRDAPLAHRRLLRIAGLLDRLTFAELLRTVYERYPEFAARSVFRR